MKLKGIYNCWQLSVRVKYIRSNDLNTDKSDPMREGWGHFDYIENTELPKCGCYKK